MRIRRLLIGMSTVVFLLVGAIGVAYSGAMMGHGDMAGCPLMGHDTAMCSMNPLEHLTQWQNMFAAVPAQTVVTLLLTLLTLFFVFCLSQYLWLLHPSPQPVYVSYDPRVRGHDSLRRFIARGLMHPKVF